MVTIQGLGGIPEPKSDRTAKVKDTKDSATKSGSSVARDGVIISTEAQAAARVAQLVQTSSTQTDIRADRVAAARERIERGDYKNPEIVAKVAEKISKYLP